MARPGSQRGKYNEQFFRSMGGPGPTAVGILVILLIVVGLYLAFTKQIPFTGRGYEVSATFENSANIRTTSPVRIAGVNVGEVTGVERAGDASKVTFTVSDEGRPIHEDATAKIRPRIFLEGNFFIDLNPGSPSAPEMSGDDEIPITRTATAVQLDEVLTTLQSPARQNLAQLLEGFGTALTYEPRPLDDRDQDPAVHGESAAESINDTFDYGAAAGRDTAIVNQSFLGTEQGDLSGLIRALGRVSGTLISREAQLQDLITNFNVTTGALAAESDNLALTIRRLAPTLATTRRSLVDLNSALPFLRRFAIELRPGVAELPATIRAADPWLDQVGPLLTNRELGGLARLLRRGTPGLAGAAGASLEALPRLKLFSRCVSEVLVPTGDTPLGGQFSTGVPNVREFFYGTVQLAGESQNFDGNGPSVRFQPGGGPVKVRMANPAGGANGNQLTGFTIAPPQGSQPVLGAKPPYNSKIACYRSGVPNLNGPAAAVGPPSPGQIP